MNCTQYQNMLDDYLDGSLSVIQLNNTQAHLNACNDCHDIFSQSENILAVLKDIPVPPAKLGYEQRVLSFLDKKQNQSKNWFIAGFGSAIAASFALWLVLSPLAIIDSKNINSVNLIVQKQQTVDLVFSLANELIEATLTLELPNKIEISGYPGKRQLSWKTSFKKGANRLALPLIAKEDLNGILIAHLSSKGTTKTFRIQIDTSQPSSSLLIQNKLTTNT